MTLRVRDIDRWYKVTSGALAFHGDKLRTVAVTVSSVGPTRVMVVPFTVNSKGQNTWLEDDAVLGGVVEGREAIEVTWGGNFALIFDEGVEVWALRDNTPVSVPADPALPKFTRFEKQGLFMDELSVALHRQAVLTRLATKSETEAATRREVALQDKLEEMSRAIAALAPKPDAKPDAQPNPKPGVKSGEEE